MRPIEQSAAEFLVEKTKQSPGEITLIAVGPLENVADALRLDPGFGKRLRRVVLSGCVYRKFAEYNVKAAIKDAELVYAAGLPLSIVPLDTTTQVKLTHAEREQVRAHDSPLTRALELLYRLWIATPDRIMTLHDQLAVAEAARPGRFLAKKTTLPLRVDEDGFTVIDEQRGKPVVVCLEPKRDEFMQYYLSQLVGQRLSRSIARGAP